MSRWLHRLRFLWEEDTPPPGGTRTRRPGPGPEAPAEPAGVPRSVRQAGRFVLIGVLTSGLMAEIIGIRMVAPVDAAPSYVAQCIQANCKGLMGQPLAECNRACQQGAGTGPSALSAPAASPLVQSAVQPLNTRAVPPLDPWWYRWFALSPDAERVPERSGL
jgi:hypothetical protein